MSAGIFNNCRRWRTVVPTTLAVLILSSGCGHDNIYSIDPAALEGCRSPSEEGCEECCEQHSDYFTIWGTTDYSTSTWYVELDDQPGEAPSSCPPCAQCSEEDEKRLRKVLNVTSKCSCEHHLYSADACLEAVDDCPCTCTSLLFARSTCPPLDPSFPW